jgi:hypothetical protein
LRLNSIQRYRSHFLGWLFDYIRDRGDPVIFNSLKKSLTRNLVEQMASGPVEFSFILLLFILEFNFPEGFFLKFLYLLMSLDDEA